jgi:hypothetical protein
MTPYSSDKEKYNTGYIGWLSSYSKHWLTIPVKGFDELVEWANMTLFLIVYCVCILTFPVTLPILSLIVMIQEKRKMIKHYGKDALVGGRK